MKNTSIFVGNFQCGQLLLITCHTGKESGDLHRSKGPCDVFDPWVRWERGQVGIWESARRQRQRRRRLEIWECLLASKLVWNGSIWLDMAWYSRQNYHTGVAHLFCFQEIIENWPRGPKKRPMTPNKRPRCPKQMPMTQKLFFNYVFCFSQKIKIRPFRMRSY